MISLGSMALALIALWSHWLNTANGSYCLVGLTGSLLVVSSVLARCGSDLCMAKHFSCCLVALISMTGVWHLQLFGLIGAGSINTVSSDSMALAQSA